MTTRRMQEHVKAVKMVMDLCKLTDQAPDTTPAMEIVA